ncbi:MAG: hypothetical protein RIC89_19425 [Pseudomonadales bacterium]
MNWDAIGAIGEVVGALAVVISLVYLALQIRQNSRQVEEQIRGLQRQAFDAAGADFSALRLHTSSSPQLASVWRRAKQNYLHLDPDEQAQANELFHEYLWAFHNIYSRIESGRSDELLASLVEVNIPFWFENRGVREWWLNETVTPFSPGFKAEIDQICRAVENKTQAT